jgi:hypothetical protein
MRFAFARQYRVLSGFTLVDLSKQFRDERYRVYSFDAVFFSDELLRRGISPLP